MNEYKIRFVSEENDLALEITEKSFCFEDAVLSAVYWNFSDDTYNMLASSDLFQDDIESTISVINQAISPTKVVSIIENGFTLYQEN